MNIVKLLLILFINKKINTNINYKNNLKIISNENLNMNYNIYDTIALLFVMLPYIYKNGENCNTDDDCPHIMRCCKIGTYNYCCTPNNYIKMEYAYIKNYIKNN